MSKYLILNYNLQIYLRYIFIINKKNIYNVIILLIDRVRIKKCV
jgi:hypothetical protein